MTNGDLGRPTMRISLLHTIDGNKRVFDETAKTLGFEEGDLRHAVRVDLREAVQQAGAFSEDLKAQTARCLLDLAAESDAVIVSCATLGPVVDDIQRTVAPIVRADRALAVAAAKAGGKIAVLCAVASTIEANRRLFEAHIDKAGTSVEIVHVAPAWALYQSGDVAGSLAAVAVAADEAYAAGAAVVAFAHPWMAPAVGFVRASQQPLHSADAALRAVRERSATSK